MKQYYILLVTLILFSFSQAQIINIPDVDFKNALLNDTVADFDGDGTYDGDVDTNNDGEIQESEAELVLGLNVNAKGIVSLIGIQSFTNLTKLSCVSNSITILDVSSNTSLIELVCNFNHIMTGLTIGNNTNLIKIECDTNELTTFDITQVPNLEVLICEYNLLVDLDISQNLNLKTLRCRYNKLTSIDATNNSELLYLDCDENELISLNIKNNSIETSLSFNTNPNLATVCADTAQLTDVQNLIDVYGYTNCVIGDDCLALDIVDYALDNSIGFYPNPGKDVVYIQGKNNLKEITVFDVNGRVLSSISVVGTQLEKELNVTKLTQGVYFVRVVSSKGQFVSKLIKG